MLAEDTGVQPHLRVAPRADFTDKNLPGLRDGSYGQVAQVIGEQSWTSTAPYCVTIVPSALPD